MHKNTIRLAALAVSLMVALLQGCGGGGGGSSASSGGSAEPVRGIATPSNVSVVTAQNAAAGG